MAGFLGSSYTQRVGGVYKTENSILEQVFKDESSVSTISATYPVKQTGGIDASTGKYSVDLLESAEEQAYGLVTDLGYAKSIESSTSYDVIRFGQISVLAGGDISIGANVKWDVTNEKYIAHEGELDTDLVIGVARTLGAEDKIFVLEVNLVK